MNRPAFRRILQRYENGQSPADERALVEQWYALLDNADIREPQSAADWKRIEARIWNQIQAQQPQTKFRLLYQNRFWQHSTFRFAAAASVAFLLGAMGWWVIQQSANTSLTATNSIPTGLIERVNQTRKPQRLELTDGSHITLQPGGRIRYPAQFSADKREVYLTGIAFFEVAKNPKQPFFVYANELTTKVLGTSFWVRALPNNPQVQVVVRTGRVSVFSPTTSRTLTNNIDQGQSAKRANGLILTPNQQVVFSRAEATFSKSLVAEPLALKPYNFTFRNTPTSDVLRAIGQTYGVTIIYDEALLTHCPLTATLTQETLYGKLDLICRAIGADYQLIDGQIVISTTGCDAIQ
jgi:transmembrane sensor